MRATRSTSAALLTLTVTAAGWIGVGLIAPAVATPKAASALTCPAGQDRIGSARRVFATGVWISHGPVMATGGPLTGDWTSTVPVSTLIVYAGTGSVQTGETPYDPPVTSGTWETDGRQHVDTLLFCGAGSTPTPTTTTPTPTTTTPTPTTTTPTPTTTTPTPTTTTPRTSVSTSVLGIFSSRPGTPSTSVLGGFTSRAGSSSSGVLPRTGGRAAGLTMIATALVLAGGLLWATSALLPVALRRGRQGKRR